MALGNTTDPSSCSQTQGPGSARPCVCLGMERTADRSKVSLTILFMRSFENNASLAPPPTILHRPAEHPFPPTPASFGEPLARPEFEPLYETWIISSMPTHESLIDIFGKSYISWVD